MRMRLKKKCIVKFEELLEKLDESPFIYTKIKPIEESYLYGMNVLTATIGGGKEIGLFYDMVKYFVCLKDNDKWFYVQDTSNGINFS